MTDLEKELFALVEAWVARGAKGQFVIHGPCMPYLTEAMMNIGLDWDLKHVEKGPLQYTVKKLAVT